MNHKLAKYLSILLSLGSVVFGVLYFDRLINQIDTSSLQLQWPYLALGTVLFGFFYVLLSIHWQVVANMFGNTNNRQWLSFFASQPYKYLPTSLFTFSFRAKYSKMLSMPLGQSSKAQLVENLSLVLSGFSVSILALLVWRGMFVVLAVLAVFACILLFVSPDVFSIKVRQKSIKLSKESYAQIFALSSAGWVVSGLAFYCISRSINQSVDIAGSIAANSAAYVTGILAFFAPGGIGIREAVFTLFSIAGLAIVLWRLVTFMVDMVLGWVAVFMVGRYSKS